MKVTVNGESIDLPPDLSVSEMIEQLSLPPRRMAVELNDQVLRRKDWEKHRIREHDKIEIVHFVGGG